MEIEYSFISSSGHLYYWYIGIIGDCPIICHNIFTHDLKTSMHSQIYQTRLKFLTRQFPGYTSMPYRRKAWWLFKIFFTQASQSWSESHYIDVIMGAMASQITGVTIVYSTVLSRRRSKKTSKLSINRLHEGGSSPVTGELSSQRASNAENVSIRWLHHASILLRCLMAPYYVLSSAAEIREAIGCQVAYMKPYVTLWQQHDKAAKVYLTIC